MCRSGQGILVPLAGKVGEGIHETGLPLFLDGLSLDPVCSALPGARCTEEDLTGLGSLDTWLPYHWETGNVLDLLEIHTTTSRTQVSP